MTLSETKAEASAATLESAQTGQVGKSHPRGSELGATVDVTSAAAAIVTSLRSEALGNLTLICLTKSQHKCVRFTLFRRLLVLRCSELLSLGILTCTVAQAASNE